MQVSAGYPEAASVDNRPSASDVRAQLNRILASSDFRASQRHGALLRYLVEESLAGRGDLQKGFTVANAVFGRDVSFDPQRDAVVRLAVRRLRTAIDAYYGTTGAHDPLRIAIPKGHYRAFFEWREDLSADSPGKIYAEAESGDVVPGRKVRKRAPLPRVADSSVSSRNIRRVPVFLLSCVTVATGFWAWTLSGPDTTHPRSPAVIVLPFDTLSTNADDRFLASGITQELITDLMRFPALRLYTVPTGSLGVTNADADELRGAYVLSGNIASSNSMIRLGVQLADARTGEIIWSETYDREMTPGAQLAARSDLAKRVATALGQLNGAVGNVMAVRSSSHSIPDRPGFGPDEETRLAAGETAE